MIDLGGAAGPSSGPRAPASAIHERRRRTAPAARRSATSSARWLDHGVRRRAGRLSMSRWATSTRRRRARGSAAARCSAIATERWRPPVQPIAIVRWALPSATYCGSRKSSSGDEALVELRERPSRSMYVDDARVVAGQRAQRPARSAGWAGSGRRRRGRRRAAGPCLKPKLWSVTASRRRGAARQELVGDLARAACAPSGRSCRSRRRRDRCSGSSSARSAATPCGDAALGRERVAPARLLVAGQQRLLVGVEEQHAVA